jgi:Na+/proline symporter
MRALVVIGVLLLVIGVVVLGFQGVTYFTQERVVDAGPVKVDVQKPHTIIFNPIAGVATVGAGLVLVLISALASLIVDQPIFGDAADWGDDD